MSFKKATNAYHFFFRSRIEENKRQNKTDYKNLMEFNKHCAQIWKLKPEAEKRKFRIMEECDRRRSNVEKKIKRRQMVKEKVERLKKGQSALFFYEKSIRAELPYSKQCLRLKAAAERFKKLSEEQRQHFENLAAEDRQRYRREKKHLSEETKKKHLSVETKKRKRENMKKKKVQWIENVQPDKICSKEFISDSDSDSD